MIFVFLFFFTGVFLPSLQGELINVALGKPAYMSSLYENHAASFGVDGRTDTIAHALRNDEWFVVDLLKEFRILYVVVFSKYVAFSGQRLKNFKVGLTSNFNKDKNKPVRGKYKLCGQWSGNVYAAHVPMRVNCIGRAKKARYVILQNSDEKKDAYLNFNQIEVYTENSDVKNRYMGCYGELSDPYSGVGIVTNVEECYRVCGTKKTSFALIKSASECFCSDHLPDISSPSSQCSLKCSADDNPCGSSQLHSVYHTKAVKSANKKYLGCYIDEVNRDLPIQFYHYTNMKIEFCIETCLKKGLPYFGLEDSYLCFCGNSYGRYGAGEGCDKPCSGNSSQICGGEFRSSVYEICYTYEGLLDTCSKELHHCSGGNPPSLEGKCESCEAGWKPPTCLLRDCYVSNGGCGEHKCEKYRVGEVETDECVCNKGYFKKSFNDQCQGGLMMNVALGKPAYMSSQRQHWIYEALKGVDGLTDTMAIALNTDKWFVVDLLKEFKIKYVVVFSTGADIYEQKLSNFKVGLTSNFDLDNNKPVRGQYELCGQWSGDVYDEGVPMRLNCSGGAKKARYVILQNSDENKYEYLHFNEIEVYVANFLKVHDFWEEEDRMKNEQIDNRMKDVIFNG